LRLKILICRICGKGEFCPAMLLGKQEGRKTIRWFSGYRLADG
jgi:hypothetical protein